MHYLTTRIGTKIPFEVRLKHARWLRATQGVDLLGDDLEEANLLSLFSNPLDCFEFLHQCTESDQSLEEFEDMFDVSQFSDLVEEVKKEILFFIQSLDPRRSLLLSKSLEKAKKLGQVQLERLERMLNDPRLEKALVDQLNQGFDKVEADDFSTLLETIGKQSTSGQGS